MKTKVIILIAISAVVTLSFTFASAKKTAKPAHVEVQSKTADVAPAGGFGLEDKL